MSRVPVAPLLKATILSGWLLLAGCQSQPKKDFSFVEEAIFPLPVANWTDVQDKHLRTIEFDCSFEDYATWLIKIEGYRDSVGLENDEDTERNRLQIIDYLSRKKPGKGYQGAYVGFQWLADDASPPFAVRVTSHVCRPRVVSVGIEAFHLR